MGRRLQTVAAVTCMKLMLMVYNIIFWITGIFLLVFGVWMKLSLHQFLELSDDYDSAVPFIFIGTGAAIVLVGFFACCCTVKGQSVLLYMLSFFLGIILILELVAGISGYIYRQKIADGFRTGLNNSLASYGKGGIKDKDLDLMQSQLKCCGVDNYTDWERKWHNKSVPESCCRDHEDCYNSEGKVVLDKIYTSGCYVKVVDFINHNLGAIGGGAVGLACFQLLGIMLSFCLAKHVNKAKYEPMA